MSEHLGADHGPIEADFHDQMNALAEALDQLLNGPSGSKASVSPIGFFLATYRMSDPGRFNYISNSEKLVVRAMLKEIIARIEGRMAEGGRA